MLNQITVYGMYGVVYCVDSVFDIFGSFFLMQKVCLPNLIISEDTVGTLDIITLYNNSLEMVAYRNNMIPYL